MNRTSFWKCKSWLSSPVPQHAKDTKFKHATDTAAMQQCLDVSGSAWQKTMSSQKQNQKAHNTIFSMYNYAFFLLYIFYISNKE